jgi:hypothetical protein
MPGGASSGARHTRCRANMQHAITTIGCARVGDEGCVDCCAAHEHEASDLLRLTPADSATPVTLLQHVRLALLWQRSSAALPLCSHQAP